MKHNSKTALKTGLATGLLLSLLTPANLFANSQSSYLGVSSTVFTNSEARTEQAREGVPTAAEIRAHASIAVGSDLDENDQVTMKDPGVFQDRTLQYQGIETVVLRVNGEYAAEILDDAGYEVPSTGAIMPFNAFSENIYVGRSEFKDVDTGSKVEVDTWLTYDNGEFDEIAQVISRVDGDPRIQYDRHATSDLTSLD